MPDTAAVLAPAIGHGSDALLAARLAEIRHRWPHAETDAITDIVRCVLATMRGDLTRTESALLCEVEELGRTIANARAEIAALKVDDITVSHIPSATDELDAIVAHTAAATNSILEVCETLDQVAGSVDGATAQQLQEATTRIYEACSFQDITGQRITKVVATLKAIDSKVAQIIAAFGGRQPSDPPPAVATPAEPVAAADAEVVPMHGPQLPAAAMDQSDIDKLLASFD
jgi:chemotaxis protein CheZ